MFKPEKLISYLDSLEDKYKVPGGEIRICKGYEEIFRYTFGDRTQAENAGKDRYWFYSMSKVYTMVSVMQLIEKGVLSLDTKLTDIFPSLLKVDPAIEKTTLRNLMSMTGGLSYEMNGPALTKLREEDPECEDPDKFVEAIYRDAMIAEPGVEFNYSLCHDICSSIIWKVTGLSLDRYMEENIFKPLGITGLSFFPDEEEMKKFIQQYERVGDHFEKVTQDNQLIIGKKFASGGAGLSGDIVSYMTMPMALSNGGVSKDGYQVLKKESIDLLRTDQLGPMGLTHQLHKKFVNHGLENFSYALGVRTKVIADDNSPVGEFGWDGAAGGYVLMDTENQITVGYLQHTMNFGEVYGEIHPTIRELVYEGLR